MYLHFKMAEARGFPYNHAYTVLFTGHSMVQYGLCDRNDPTLAGLNINAEFQSLRGAMAKSFLDRAEVRQAISSRPDLVFLWLGSNDIRKKY